MKVLLLNGSTHEKGCTYTALSEVAGALETAGIEPQIVHVGAGPVRGCTGCKSCAETGRCVFDDIVNEILPLAKEADGYIFGSPVHYAGAAGVLTTVLDRLFYVACKPHFAHKPGAAVISCRRGGGTAALDRLNKYFTFAQMPVVSSKYWNVVHGNTPEEVREDLEGMQTMRILGENMAFLLRCIEAGKAAGVPLPAGEPPIRTSFIRPLE